MTEGRRHGRGQSDDDAGQHALELIDGETGAGNAAIGWPFRVGDQIEARLFNEMAGDQPIPHPFHVHGAGRFLVLSRDRVVEPNWSGRTLASPVAP